MRVPLLDIPASYEKILQDVKKNIDQVIQSGQFVLGPIVEELEQKIANYCDTKYAVGVSSGTDALLISLMAAELEKVMKLSLPLSLFLQPPGPYHD